MKIRNQCKVLGKAPSCHAKFQNLIQFESSLCESTSAPIFDSVSSTVNIDDDHMPFYRKGVRNILHLISYPFSNVWHTMNDDMEHLDLEIVSKFTKILQLYLTDTLRSGPDITGGSIFKAISPICLLLLFLLQ